MGMLRDAIDFLLCHQGITSSQALSRWFICVPTTVVPGFLGGALGSLNASHMGHTTRCSCEV